jgi:hypothetical protein
VDVQRFRLSKIDVPLQSYWVVIEKFAISKMAFYRHDKSGRSKMTAELWAKPTTLQGKQKLSTVWEQTSFPQTVTPLGVVLTGAHLLSSGGITGMISPLPIVTWPSSRGKRPGPQCPHCVVNHPLPWWHFDRPVHLGPVHFTNQYTLQLVEDLCSSLFVWLFVYFTGCRLLTNVERLAVSFLILSIPLVNY